jgi:thiosulfate dehydrogenase
METRSKIKIKVTHLVTAGLILVLTIIAALPIRTAYSQAEPIGDLTRGGRLFASWDNLAIGALPDDLHPLWPENISGEFPPRYTWRCVNCHGWDYSGSQSRSFLTATRAMEYPNLFSMVAKPEEEILAYLDGSLNPDHDFSPYLTEQDLKDLSTFLSKGLILPELIADWETFQVWGTVENGKQNYEQQCASCHGLEGEIINLSTVENPVFLGDLSLSNPWRVAHQIRFGHPQTRVPPAEMLGLSFSQQIDTLAYIQTMPVAVEIVEKQFLALDFDLQASTVPLLIGAMLVGSMILVATWVTLKRNQ